MLSNKKSKILLPFLLGVGWGTSQLGRGGGGLTSHLQQQSGRTPTCVGRTWERGSRNVINAAGPRRHDGEHREAGRQMGRESAPLQELGHMLEGCGPSCCPAVREPVSSPTVTSPHRHPPPCHSDDHPLAQAVLTSHWITLRPSD